MPIIAAVTTVVGILFVLHAVHTGRPRWWIFVILAAPVLGPLCYVLFEVIPNTSGVQRAQRSVDAALKQVSRTLAPDAELAARVAEVERCGSVKNMTDLAEECVQTGRPEEACRLYRACLAGPYRDDPNIKFGLLQAEFAAGDHPGARSTAEDLLAGHPGYKSSEVKLALARMHELAGELHAAEGLYDDIVATYPGEAARYHYAVLLKAQGRSEQAKAQLETILANSARASALYRDQEKAWIKAARRELSV
jgi:hypothetical protein